MQFILSISADVTTADVLNSSNANKFEHTAG
jgi:hypothetical protein